MEALAQTIGLNQSDRFRRLAYLLVPLFLLILLDNKASLTVIAAIVAVAFLYACARQQLWLLVALAIPSLVFGEVAYIAITDSWIYEARLAEILFFLAAAVYALDLYLNARTDRIRFDIICFLLAVYLFLTLASIMYVVDARLYVFGIKTAVFGFLGYFLAINLLDNRLKLKAFLYGVAATVVILSFQIFYKFYELGFSSKFFFERNTITIPIGPLATTAAILALLVLVVVGFYLQLQREKDKYAPFLLGVIGLGSLAVFLSLGKAAILSFALGLFYLFVKIGRTRLPLVLLTLWFVTIAYFVFNPFFTGLFERISTTMVDTNTKFRISEYETGWEIIQDHYLIGVGAGQQLHFYKALYDRNAAQLVDNYLLQAILDLGLIGLSVFLILYGRIIKLATSDRFGPACLCAGFVAALVCAAVNGLFEVTIFALPYAFCFWLLLGAFKNAAAYVQPSANRKNFGYINN